MDLTQATSRRRLGLGWKEGARDDEVLLLVVVEVEENVVGRLVNRVNADRTVPQSSRGTRNKANRVSGSQSRTLKN
jgi:hypothetical protein